MLTHDRKSLLRLILISGLSAGVFIAPSSVSAQADATSGGCVAPDPADGQSSDDANSLSGKIQDCNGVLQPPKTGDGDIVEPTPDAGNTPVVKPGDLPESKNRASDN